MTIFGIFLIIFSVLTIFLHLKNLIFVILSIELFFLGIVLYLLDNTIELDDFEGLTNSFLITIIAALETVIILLILLFRRKSIFFE